jgi:hypothetical protein
MSFSINTPTNASFGMGWQHRSMKLSAMSPPNTREEIARAQARLVYLLGICPNCGDAGWWIDDFVHYCECPAGHAARVSNADYRDERDDPDNINNAYARGEHVER